MTEPLSRSQAGRELATAVLELTPYQIARRQRGRYARLVLDVARSADADTARRGLAAVLPQWLPWDADGIGTLVDLVTDLDHTATWRPALTALVAGVGVVGDDVPVVVAARRLSAADDESLDGPKRHRPARQRLRALVAEVVFPPSPRPGRTSANGPSRWCSHPSDSLLR